MSNQNNKEKNRDMQFIKVHNNVFFDILKNVGKSEALIYITLLSHKNSKNINGCYPSVKTMQQETGISETTINKAITNLSERGYITIRSGTKGIANRYYFPYEKEMYSEDVLEEVSQYKRGIENIDYNNNLRKNTKPNNTITEAQNDTSKANRKQTNESTSNDTQSVPDEVNTSNDVYTNVYTPDGVHTNFSSSENEKINNNDLCSNEEIDDSPWDLTFKGLSWETFIEDVNKIISSQLSDMDKIKLFMKKAIPDFIFSDKYKAFLGKNLREIYNSQFTVAYIREDVEITKDTKIDDVVYEERKKLTLVNIFYYWGNRLWDDWGREIINQKETYNPITDEEVFNKYFLAKTEINPVKQYYSTLNKDTYNSVYSEIEYKENEGIRNWMKNYYKRQKENPVEIEDEHTKKEQFLREAEEEIWGDDDEWNDTNVDAIDNTEYVSEAQNDTSKIDTKQTNESTSKEDKTTSETENDVSNDVVAKTNTDTATTISDNTERISKGQNDTSKTDLEVVNESTLNEDKNALHGKIKGVLSEDMLKFIEEHGGLTPDEYVEWKQIQIDDLIEEDSAELAYRELRDKVENF